MDHNNHPQFIQQPPLAPFPMPCISTYIPTTPDLVVYTLTTFQPWNSLWWVCSQQKPNKLKMSLLTSQVHNRVMNRSGCHRRIPFNSLSWWRGLKITLKEMKNIENIKQSQFNFMLIMSRKSDWQELYSTSIFKAVT